MKCILTLSLFLLPYLVAGQTNTQHQKDSMRMVISQTKDIEKLRAYNRLATLYFAESKDPLKMDTMIALYKELDAEAKRQGNKAHQGIARGNTLAAFINARNYSEIFKRAPRYLKELEEIGEWTYYFHIYKTLVEARLFNGEFDEAIRVATKMYEQARRLGKDEDMGQALLTMAGVYAAQRRQEESENHLRQGLKLIEKEDRLLSLAAKGWFDLCQTLLSENRYEDALEAASRFEAVNERYDAHAGVTVATSWGNLWGVYARLYVNTGEYDKAEAYCQKIDSIIDSPRYKIIVYHTRAKILNAQGHYAEALAMADRADLLKDNYTLSSNNTRQIRMRALMHLGRLEEAYSLFEEIMLVNDSTNNAKFAEQLGELRTRYEVDLHITEKEKKHQQLLCAVIVCGLLLIALTIYIVYSRRLKKKNLILYNQIQESLRKQTTKISFSRLSRDDKQEESFRLEELVEIEEAEEGDNKSLKLFRHFNDLILREKLFMQTDIDRRSLADRLGTNEKYLSNAIREGSGDSLPSYISKLRLKYALELLNEHPDMKLEAVATESGHGSYISFYRAFTKQYGITPSEYVKIRKREGN